MLGETFAGWLDLAMQHTLSLELQPGNPKHGTRRYSDNYLVFSGFAPITGRNLRKVYEKLGDITDSIRVLLWFRSAVNTD